MKLSVIVPVLNEAESLASFLRHLQPLRAQGHELILVDGGSSDGSPQFAYPLCDAVIESEPGRARQMNAGAALASGDWLLFLHADTCLPKPFAEWEGLIAQTRQTWGRFNVRLSSDRWFFRIIERAINIRSALTGIATGDQAIFIRRERFNQLNGYADQPLMEDVELCRRLKKRGAPLCLKQPVITSSRRWEAKGVFRTVLLMWELRLRYYLGAKPSELVRRYYPSADQASRCNEV